MSVAPKSLIGRQLSAYLAPDDFVEQTLLAIDKPLIRQGQLLICEGPGCINPWARNIWYDAKIVAFDSITDAAKILMNEGRNWASYGVNFFRRTQHIVDKLPFVSNKPRVFPFLAPKAPLGSFSLLEERLLIYAAKCSSPYPNGDPNIQEIRVGPPSRAYLKLAEALSLCRSLPQPGSICVEFGASPGGWTWLLDQLGTTVLSFDRAPLEVALSSRVTHSCQDAFKVLPDQFTQQVDWLFSDIISFPHRQFEFISEWIASGKVSNVVATVKFKGSDDYSIADGILGTRGSRLLHLSHNKHELTWLWSS